MHKIPEDALFIVDGSYLLYRSFYALKPLYTSDGVPTQATYGFCRTIKKFIDKFDPTNIIVAWDHKGKTFRSEIYADYKATRQAPPNELFEQKKDIMHFLDLIGINQISVEGYEADDLIYSIVKDYKDKDIVIVCPDKDLFQLLNKNVIIFDPFKEQLIDKKTYEEEHGIKVDRINFYYSLLGDTSDNIPGVAGVGEKTAKELVNKFESLEDLYENLDKVEKERIREALKTNKSDAFLSQKLFTLKHHALNLKEKDYKFDKENWNNAGDFFRKMEFKSLVKTVKESQEEEQLSILGQAPKIEEAPKAKLVNYTEWQCILVQTPEALEEMISAIKNANLFALDTETTGGNPLLNELVGFSVSVNKKEAYYVPLAHVVNDGEPQLNREETLAKLKLIFESKRIKKVLHNTKFDKLVLSQYNIWLDGVCFDTLLAASLVKKEWQKINLKALSEFYLGEPMQKFKDVLGNKHKTFATVPIKEGAKYGSHDALQTFKLKLIFEKELDANPKFKKIFEDMEMPLSGVLTRMEKAGIELDVEKLAEIGKNVDKAINKVETKIFAAFQGYNGLKDTEINLNSPQQIEKLLFEHLELPVVKKSATGRRSTDQEVLEELSKVHPIPGLILRYRELTKLKNTYIDPLPKFVNPKTGRVHTTYSQTFVATGRLSSQEPNLQNIPTGDGDETQIRAAFVAPRGYRLLSADYSQIELRVLAHMTKDEALTKAFLHDQDIHTQTASQIFGISPDKVTTEQRQVGKRINFSIIYGLTPYGLSRDLDIKPSQAKEYIEAYFKQYPKVHSWIEKTIEEAIKNGFTQTWWGRRRYIPELSEHNRTLLEAGKRIATNSPVQGTSAEIIKLAMIRVDKAFQEDELDAAILLQIHDELIIQFHADLEDKIEKIVKKEMEGVVDWEVPFKVSIRTGKNWGEITK
jgi:DNA polymerase-1